MLVHSSKQGKAKQFERDVNPSDDPVWIFIVVAGSASPSKKIRDVSKVLCYILQRGEDRGIHVEEVVRVRARTFPYSV